MSKPENSEFNFVKLERKIKHQMLDLWHLAQEKKYNAKRWDEFQSDFDWYVSNVKRLLKLDKL
jgi:hypothetical protein